MKKWLSRFSLSNRFVVLIGVVVLIIPFISVAFAYMCLKVNVFSKPDFWYGYMAYFGTVVLATVAVYQSQQSISLSKKFDEMNAKQNYSFARTAKGCNISIKHNNDRTIIWSAHHKLDADALVILCDDVHDNDGNFNEYLFELYFKDYSKAALKNFEIEINQMAIMQEPSPNGLHWSSGSTVHIQVGFQESPSGNVAHPNWVGDNTFQIMLKIYSTERGRLAHMIEGNETIFLVFNATLTSVCGIKTEMRYKYELKKGNGKITIERNESQLISVL